jgi:hypothetical protein
MEVEKNSRLPDHENTWWVKHLRCPLRISHVFKLVSCRDRQENSTPSFSSQKGSALPGLLEYIVKAKMIVCSLSIYIYHHFVQNKLRRGEQESGNNKLVVKNDVHELSISLCGWVAIWRHWWDWYWLMIWELGLEHQPIALMAGTNVWHTP